MGVGKEEEGGRETTGEYVSDEGSGSERMRKGEEYDLRQGGLKLK